MSEYNISSKTNNQLLMKCTTDDSGSSPDLKFSIDEGSSWIGIQTGSGEAPNLTIGPDRNGGPLLQYDSSTGVLTASNLPGVNSKKISDLISWNRVVSYYVDPILGSDNNGGSALTPFKTIAKAFAQVVNQRNLYGATIYINIIPTYKEHKDYVIEDVRYWTIWIRNSDFWADCKFVIQCADMSGYISSGYEKTVVLDLSKLSDSFGLKDIIITECNCEFRDIIFKNTSNNELRVACNYDTKFINCEFQNIKLGFFDNSVNELRNVSIIGKYDNGFDHKSDVGINIQNSTVVIREPEKDNSFIDKEVFYQVPVNEINSIYINGSSSGLTFREVSYNTSHSRLSITLTGSESITTDGTNSTIAINMLTGKNLLEYTSNIFTIVKCKDNEDRSELEYLYKFNKFYSFKSGTSKTDKTWVSISMTSIPSDVSSGHNENKCLLIAYMTSDDIDTYANKLVVDLGKSSALSSDLTSSKLAIASNVINMIDESKGGSISSEAVPGIYIFSLKCVKGSDDKFYLIWAYEGDVYKVYRTYVDDRNTTKNVINYSNLDYHPFIKTGSGSLSKYFFYNKELNQLEYYKLTFDSNDVPTKVTYDTNNKSAVSISNYKTGIYVQNNGKLISEVNGLGDISISNCDEGIFSRSNSAFIGNILPPNNIKFNSVKTPYNPILTKISNMNSVNIIYIQSAPDIQTLTKVNPTVLGYPDYSSGVLLYTEDMDLMKTPYTVEQDGFIYAHINGGRLMLNNSEVLGAVGASVGALFPVKSGDKIYALGDNNGGGGLLSSCEQSFVFYPLLFG